MSSKRDKRPRNQTSKSPASSFGQIMGEVFAEVVIEFIQSFGWMDNCRRLVVRYERHVHLYKAFCLVAIILWCIDRILK